MIYRIAMTVGRALLAIGPELVGLIRAGKDEDAKRRAREETETAIDVAIAKERLRARKKAR